MMNSLSYFTIEVIASFRRVGVALLLLFAACGSPQPQAPQGTAPVSRDRQMLQDVNRYLHEREQDVLASYVVRYQLDMTLAPSGYYYQVVEQGGGAAVAEGSAAHLHGWVRLIDGTLCYTYVAQSPLSVRVGAHTDYKALNTALIGLREGAKVRFVFPSHLAFGLLGDGDKIPPRSALVCEFVVVNVGD